MIVWIKKIDGSVVAWSEVKQDGKFWEETTKESDEFVEYQKALELIRDRSS